MIKKILICLFIIIVIINSGCRKKTDDTKMTPEEELIKCEGSINNLAKACEIYAGHNNGHYPPNLDAVNPYIKTIPVCPACKKPYIYESQTEPDFFIIKCGGDNVHRETGLVGEGNYPVYNSKEGLIRKGSYLTSLPSNVSHVTPSPEGTAEERPTEIEETPLPEKTPARKVTPGPTKKPEKIDPKAAEHNSKGLALMKQDKYDEALEEFNKAIEIEPDYLDAIKNKGNTYYYKADIEKALECYELTISKDPSYWSGYNNIGNIYFDQNENDKAEEYYRKAAELCKDDYKPYNNLGDVLIQKGNYEEAIKSYEKAIGFGIKNGELYCQLGTCYWHISEEAVKNKDEKKALEYTNKALEYLGKATELDPDDPEPYFRGGRLYANMGPKYYDKSIECLDKAIKIDPEEYRYLYCRGQIYETKDEKAKARQDYEKALPLAEKAKDNDMIKKINEALKNINSGKG